MPGSRPIWYLTQELQVAPLTFRYSSRAVPEPGDTGRDGSRYIPYKPDNGAWLNAAEDQPGPWLPRARGAGMDARDDAGHGAGGRVDLKLGHHARDGIEVIDVPGEIDIYTAPRLRELLIDLVSKGNCQLVVNLDKVGFLNSTGLGVLVGSLKWVRAHGGSLNLVCTQQRILKIFRITGLTEALDIYQTVDQTIAAAKGRR